MAKTLTMRIPQKIEWSVDTPALLNDIIPNAMPKESISPSIFVIFRGLLAEVAQRATELHDPQLDILMLRLNLYEMEGKNGGEKSRDGTWHWYDLEKPSVTSWLADEIRSMRIINYDDAVRKYHYGGNVK